jgi:hypothetical protein
MPIIPPDYGTGSSYYSQNFDNIEELLQRVYDNTSNIIVAKDVRDPLWTLWNKISGLSASLGSASISYSLGTPSTISVGGIPEGSTFSNTTLSELFDQMLLPYVAPVVNNFGPSVLEKQFGDTTTLNLTYSINVGSLSLDSGYAIQFISPNPSSSIPNKVVTGNDPETGTTNNFSLTYSTATISVVSYAVATMSFRTTPDLTIFTATTSIAQKHKRYYGQISIPIGFTPSNPASVAAVGSYLTDTRIKGLSYSELSTNVNFSQVVDFDTSGQYFVFASPTVFGFNYPVGFYVDNIFTQNYTKVRSNSNLSNEFGFVAPYDVFIINDKLIDPALVSTIPLPQGYLTNNFTNVIPSVIIGDQGPTGATGPQGATGPGISTNYLKIGELDYTELNDLSYTIFDTISLTQSNFIPENSEILKLYAKCNQPFISPSGSISEFAFYGVTAGTSLLNFNFIDLPNSFTIVEPLAPQGGQPSVALFLTQSYVYGPVASIISNTSSTTYSIFCTFTDGTSSVGSNYIANPQNWISGNVSFVIEYQVSNLNTMPF